MRCFEPISERDHRMANAGHGNPDYCANCRRPFLDHYNGACPTLNGYQEPRKSAAA